MELKNKIMSFVEADTYVVFFYNKLAYTSFSRANVKCNGLEPLFVPLIGLTFWIQ